MKIYIILAVLFTVLIGTALAEDVKAGEDFEQLIYRNLYIL
jgi:hypothetical protein